MRRFFISLLALLFAGGVSAAEPVWLVLQRVSEYMNTKSGYEVSFSITAEDYKAEGRYCVQGASYYIDITDAEVYCDGEVRYEVDNQRREVNIDVMDYESRNILDNPTRCFDFVEADYTAEIVEQKGDDVKICLRSKDAAVEGDIFLTVESDTGCPIDVEYVLYGDSIKVAVLDIKRHFSAVKRFNRADYKNYEIIDFR